jgi:hypothetical protein
MFSRPFILIALLMGLSPLHAQEMLGGVNSSYSGITGSMLNPANAVTSPFYLDFNILSGDIFAENNYLYFSKEEYRFLRFFEKNPVYPTHGVDNDLIGYDNNSPNNKNAYANLRVMGPSFAVTVGRHAFGLVTAARSVMSTRNVPYTMAKFAYERFDYPPQYDINYVYNKNIYNAELAWAEIGFNYSYVFSQKSLDYWAGGVTVKYIMGYAGGYMYSENLDYIVYDQDTLTVNTINATGGYSLPLNYVTNEYMRDPLFRGKGVGFDIGLIYERKKSQGNYGRIVKLCEQDYIPYKYKIGVSLLDIGSVKFKKNAEKLVLDGNSTNWIRLPWTEFTSIRDLTDLISNQFYGNPTELIQGYEIKVALPTVASIQADVNFYKNWFVNGTLVVPVQFSKSGLRRPSVLAVTPRYETRRFEVGLPLSLYDWSKPRLGIFARYRGFFIGTEKIGGFFHYSDFYGLDFYAGIKLSFLKGSCRNSSAGEGCGINEYKLFKKKY